MSTVDTNTGHDMNAHRQTYDGVMKLFKYAIPVIAVITVFVLFLLTH